MESKHQGKGWLRGWIAALAGWILVLPAGADELYVADHLGDLWRFGTESPYRSRLGTLPTSLTGLAFKADGELLGLSSKRGIWRLDTKTGQSRPLAPPSGPLDFEYLDLAELDDGRILLLRRQYYDLWPELSRWDPATETEEVLGPISHPDFVEPIEVFSMTRAESGEIRLMDSRRIYRLDLDTLTAQDLGSDSPQGFYPDVASYGLAIDSAGNPWVLSEWTDGDLDLRLVPADLSTEGYGFIDKSRPRALAARPDPAGCTEDAQSLCLQNRRFRVNVEWRDFQGLRGPATVAPERSESAGQFWFFDSDNQELLIKVLDGCALNAHYWVSLAGTTNVEFELRVTDILTDEVRVYKNPLGRTAATELDTAAFPCEPSGREGR